MKIKLLIPILKDGQRFNEGDEINIADHKGEIWISKKWAKAIEQKESKIKKETKELKLDSKETKNETI